MRLHETTSYQTETPKFLWEAFCNGPASEYDRYKDRLTELIAEDVLEECPEQLSEDERQFAESIRRENDGVLALISSP